MSEVESSIGNLNIILEINKEFYERYSKVDGSKEFWEYMTKPLRVSVRLNTLKGSLQAILSTISKYRVERVKWCEEGYFINSEISGNCLEHQLGLIFFQEASSMIPALVLGIKKVKQKERIKVLDMAASPGAKTTQIAQYMENKGLLVANDVKVSRVNILISNLQRCGAIAHVTMCDGRKFRKYEEKFDYVLLDAPCSNVGMVRKNYKYAKVWKLKDVYSLSKLQKQLIIAAYTTLKRGGVLVYSTCTLDPMENEGVIDFLLSNTDAELEEIELDVKGVEPITKFDDMEFCSDVKKCLRIHPQCNDTEGFFVAKIVKP